MDKDMFLSLEKGYGNMPCDIYDIDKDTDDECREMQEAYENAYEEIRKVYLYMAERGGFSTKFG